MEAVGSALGDHAHHAAGVTAVFGVEARGDQLELLHAFQRRMDDRPGIAALGVVNSIEVKAEVVRAPAVDGQGAVASVPLGDDAAGQVRQVGEIAAVERDLGDLFFGGDLAPRAALGVEHGRRIGNGHALGGGADFQ
ncbi:MAG: hypothetical protein AAB253_02555, partial [candidate division NC10 bacterium]